MVKKFYMESKKGTLEQSVLDVWQNAAENGMSGEHSFEVGTNRYRNHTQNMTPGQQVEEALEMSDEEFDNLLETLTVEEIIALDEGIGSWIQKRTGLGPGGKQKRAGHLQSKAKKAKAKTQAIKDIDTAKGDIRKAKQDRKDHKAKKKADKKQAKADAAGDGYVAGTDEPTKTKTKKVPSSEKTTSDAPEAEAGKASKVSKSADNGKDATGGDEGKGGGGGANNGGNNDDAKGTAEPKTGEGKGGEGTPSGDTNDPENKDDPNKGKKKSTNGTGAAAESVVPGFEYGHGQRLMSEELAHVRMWREAADTHVNPKDRDELDGNDGVTAKGGVETAKKMKHAAEPKPMIKTEALTAKQKQIDIDGDGEIEASDLKKLRKKGAKKAEAKESLTFAQAQDFKVDSMRQALAKVWGLDEWKNTKENRRVDGGDKRRTENKKGGKTDTGGKRAEVEIDPELKEKNKK